jgi:hypothetical protein
MPIQLKNRDRLPTSDYQTVSVLGLDIPVTTDLPFGAQVELLDLQARHTDGEFGQVEYLLRIFCVFTRRLPKGEQVRYEWLAQQNLEADEVADLMRGTLELLNALQAKSAGGSGNARKKKTESSTPSS